MRTVLAMKYLGRLRVTMKHEQNQGSYLEKNKVTKRLKKEKAKDKLSHRAKRRKFDADDWCDE